ncbi:MAG TPA: hypothetical protein VIV60_11895 [Polyangiaceae bacterium]
MPRRIPDDLGGWLSGHQEREEARSAEAHRERQKVERGWTERRCRAIGAPSSTLAAQAMLHQYG